MRAVLLFALASVPCWAALSVPLTIREALYGGSIPGIARTNGAFCQGVPISLASAISGAGSLGLTGASAGQFRVLGTWDGVHAKWIEVCGVVATLTAGGTTTVTLTDSGTGNFGGADLATDGAPILVSTNGGTCGAGSAVCFEIKKANHNGIDRVRIGATTAITSGASDGFVVTGPDPTAAYPGNVTCSPNTGGTACATLYKSANDAASTCSIEKNGPVQAVVKCIGSHIDGAAHAYMKYTARYYFTQGSASVKVTSELRNADYGASGTFATAYKGHRGYEYRLVPNIAGTFNYAISGEVTSGGAGAPVTGAMTTSNTVTLYQAQSTVFASTCAGANGCIDFTPDTGYLTKRDGVTLASGTIGKYVEGWADIQDAGGVGVEIGVNELSANNPKSLEFNSGSDVRVGIWPRQNSIPYYQSWPQHATTDFFLIFHATNPVSLSNEFLKQQHYLVANAGVSYYNSTGVFPYNFADPAQENAFYANALASSLPSTTSYALTYFQDLAIADNHFPFQILRYWTWGQGSSNNQLEFRYANTLRFMQRGTPGRYLDALAFYRMQADQSFPRADGFSWQSHSTEIGGEAATPTATSANSTLAHRDWIQGPSSWGDDVGQHSHWYGMTAAYYVSGDESLHDAILDGPVNRYACSSGVCINGGIGGMWNTRAIGVYLMGTARLSQFLSDTGDSANSALVLANGVTAYNTYVKPDLCTAGWPAGCSPGPVGSWTSFGTSRVRGVQWGPRGTDVWCYTSNSCANGTYDGVAHEVNSPFQISILLQGLMEFRAVKGSGWTDYIPSFDLMYGMAQWSMNEMFRDSGTGYWQEDGWPFYTPLDQPAGDDDIRIVQSPHGGIVAATGANPMVLTVDLKLAEQLNFYVVNEGGGLAISRAAGIGCSGMNGVLTGVSVSGNQITTTFDGTGCAYIPNSARIVAASGQAVNTTTTNWHALKLYTGSVGNWLPKMQLNLAKLASTQASIDEFGTFVIADLVDDLNNPGTLSLNRVPIAGGFTDNGGGAYTFNVIVPTGASSYRIKCGTNSTTTGSRIIAEWLGYDGVLGTFKLDPAIYMPWFAANEAAGIPSPGAPGTTQGITVSCGTTAGLTASNFMVKAWSAPPLQTWTKVTPGGAYGNMQVVGWEKLTYLPALKAHVMLANYGELNSEPNRSLMAYDFEQNRWNILDSTDLFHSEYMPESGHPFGRWAYDPTRNQIIYQGSGSGSLQAENLNHIFLYDPLGQTGKDKFGAPNAWQFQNGSSEYDRVADKWVQIGADAGGEILPQQVYSPILNTWTATVAQNCTGVCDAAFPNQGISWPMVAWNPDTQAIYAFGGVTGYATAQTGFNKVYKYDAGANNWIRLTPTADPVNGLPAGRFSAGWTYDTLNHVFLLFGGLGTYPEQQRNDTWALDMNANSGVGQWTMLPTPAPPGHGGSTTTSSGIPAGLSVSIPVVSSSGIWVNANVQLDLNGAHGTNEQVQVISVPDSTHIVANVANTHTSGATVDAPGIWPFSRMSYDQAANAIVMVYTVPGGGFTPETFWLRYAGTGPAPGNGTATYSPASGSINHLAANWAQEPSIAVNGSNAYVAQSEVSTSANSHIWAEQWNGSAWVALGGQLDTENSGNIESFQTAIAYSGGKPWVSYYHYGGGTELHRVTPKGFSAGSWTGGNGPNGGEVGAGFQGPFTVLTLTAIDSVHFSFTVNSQGDFDSLQIGMFLSMANGAGTGCSGMNYASNGNFFEQVTALAFPTVTVLTGFWFNPTGCAYTNGSATAVLGTPSQGASSLADIAGTPYIAYVERETGRPQNQRLYVKSFNGAAWIPVGAGRINRNAESGNINNGPWPQIPSLSLTTDGAHPWVAWEEYTIANCSNPTCYNASVPQIYVSHWSGSAWVTNGSGLNVSTTLGWASEPSITYMAGQPYVAWVERTTTNPGIADGPARLYVKTTTDGVNWSLVGSGALNQNTATGWAWCPSLTNDGANLYLAWVEQAAPGLRAQTYVSKYTGATWTALGTSLNADPALGSSQHVSLAVMGGQPVAAWGEVNYGSMRQIFAKQWNGTNWAAVTAIAAGGSVPGQVTVTGNHRQSH